MLLADSRCWRFCRQWSQLCVYPANRSTLIRPKTRAGSAFLACTASAAATALSSCCAASPVAAMPGRFSAECQGHSWWCQSWPVEASKRAESRRAWRELRLLKQPPALRPNLAVAWRGIWCRRTSSQPRQPTTQPQQRRSCLPEICLQAAEVGTCPARQSAGAELPQWASIPAAKRPLAEEAAWRESRLAAVEA